jgi:hypothetical protein
MAVSLILEFFFSLSIIDILVYLFIDIVIIITHK